jgi:hypothetical protein
VVAPLPQEGKYVVTEGNRRLGAIRSLLEDHKNGEADLSPSVLDSMRRIPVFVIDEPEEVKQEHFARVLQGVRHVAGIRPWGPYQQAQVVTMMIDDGKDQSEICEVLGLPKRRINILRRCFYALEQMRRDDDFGDKAKPPLFSAFDEAFRLPSFRDWLEWDDERNLCMNEEHRKLYYSWLVGSEDEEGIKHEFSNMNVPSSREIAKSLIAAFDRNGELSLDRAITGVLRKHGLAKFGADEVAFAMGNSVRQYLRRCEPESLPFRICDNGRRLVGKSRIGESDNANIIFAKRAELIAVALRNCLL